MLVAGQRDGFRLTVHHAWRVYSLKVNATSLQKPIDWLRRFADRYGAEIEVGGKKGHFFLVADGPVPLEFTVEIKGKPRQITISRFTQKNLAGIERSALIVAIDIEKYRETLHDLGVNREDILDTFVPPPRPRD